MRLFYCIFGAGRGSYSSYFRSDMDSTLASSTDQPIATPSSEVQSSSAQFSVAQSIPPLPVQQFRSVRGLAKTIQFLFYAMIAYYLVVIITIFLPYNGIASFIDSSNYESVMGMFKVVDAVSVLLYLSLVVCVPIFFYRAYSNYPMISARPQKYTSGWGAGAFFVPIVSWFRPREIASELIADLSPEQAEVETSKLPHVWWGFYWAGVIFSRIERMADRSENVPLEMGSMEVSVICFLIATFTGVSVIDKIVERQYEGLRQRELALQEAPAEIAPVIV